MSRLSKATRRRFIGLTGAVAATGIAGCLGDADAETSTVDLIVLVGTLEDGNPLEGATVIIGDRSTRTDENAMARFDDLEFTSSVRYRVELDGYIPEEGTIQIPEGADQWYYEVRLEES